MRTNYLRRPGLLCDASAWIERLEVEHTADGWDDIQSYSGDCPLGDTNLRDLEQALDYAAHRIAGVSLLRWMELRREATLRFYLKTDGRVWADGQARSIVYSLLPGEHKPQATFDPPLPTRGDL